MHRHHLPLWALLAALLAGCGGSQPSGQAPSSATAPAIDPTPAEAPAVLAATPATEPTTAGEPAPTAAPAAEATPANAAGTIQLEQYAEGLRSPVFLTHAGDDSDRMFVVEKRGTIAILRDGARDETPFLDIADLITSSGSEQGLLGLAFHPDYAQNGRFFVYYTARNGDNTLARYQVSSDPDVADPASGQVLFAVQDPAPNHNGGMLAFGPDGFLYVGLGDGGSGGDPWGNGQNRSVLLGKLLRLDVGGDEPYTIPPDNPWPNGENQARSEIWAYGLRNPWRFSFDRATGDLYIGDVGQNAYEEIDFQPAGSSGGQNYGWNTREGLHCFRANDCPSNEMIDPIGEYAHDEGCSVTGGYVYRGAASPSLQGQYFFGDYCSGAIWSLSRDASGQWQQRKLLDSRLSISSFGEDAAGELYVIDLGGGLYRVTAGG
ncbi:MAG TPA: PQQ-dependent sugar dehydrogenase [Roseiflexaceae bacterium]|nr:PQQ-dependent sugar dehydrogenase [Roseiflexaceae bacterium]